MSQRTSLHHFKCFICEDECATYNFYPDQCDICEKCRQERTLITFTMYEEYAKLNEEKKKK